MMPWHGPRGKAASAIPPMDIRVIRIGQGGERQRLFNFWAQPYTPAGISDSRGTDIGKTGAWQDVEILEGRWEFCLT